MSEFFRALERAERERALRSKTAEAPGSRSYDAPAPAPPAADDPRGGEPSRRDTVVAAEVATVEAPPVDTVAVEAPAVETLDIPPVEAVPVMSAATTDEPAAHGASPGSPGTSRGATSAGTASGEATHRPLTHLFETRAGRAPGEVDEHLVSLITPDSFEADQYRVLRHTVEQRRRTAGLAVVAVSSAGPGDGKTTTAINLAGALAQDRAARVLLVDCDLRNSAMGRNLGLAEGRGLVQAIIDPLLTLEDAIRHLPRFNLDVMAAGFETASPYELLKSPRLGELFESARRRYDYIVVDTPPIVPFPDCRVLGKIVDGFLMVVSAHRTPRRLVDEALAILPKELVVGLVFNGEKRPMSQSYHRYYGEDAASRDGWSSSARRAFTRAWRDAGATGTTGR